MQSDALYIVVFKPEFMLFLCFLACIETFTDEEIEDKEMNEWFTVIVPINFI